MQLWRRSIQLHLILSMGTALLVSNLIVDGIKTLVVNRLAQR
jgi:methyl-accepting chemotaxis protein